MGLIARRAKRSTFAVKPEKGVPTQWVCSSGKVKVVLKTENGIHTYGMGLIAHRVNRTTFATKPENGIPTPWDCSSR